MDGDEREVRPGAWGVSEPMGWQPGVDFEVTGRPGQLRVATAWDEDVCVGKFETRSRLVLRVRLWLWHRRFNRSAG